MNASVKRFRVALSFPGEKRSFVAAVAEHLGDALGREQVLYDADYAGEFARPDLDTYLQRLYHDESDLIAVFLCEDYERKEWCGLEWRAIRDLVKRRQGHRVMPLRFDMTEIPGLFSSDGYLWIGDRSPAEVARLVLQRLGVGDGDPGRREDQRTAPSRLRHAADKLFGREAELARLDAAWADPKVNVVTLVAWGGVGKTSLVGKWAADLVARGYDGADFFDWTFYSQGTRERGGPSADRFVDAALRFFGDAEMAGSARSAWDKGARLAELIGRRRTLLVLDGLEPLQYPPGPLAGGLKDPAVETLLKGLAGRSEGLCVVTTRERLQGFGSFEGKTLQQWPLEQLATPAGVELMKAHGIHGAAADLAAAVEEVRGHALTLNLLGGYLNRAHRGDVRRRDRVKFEKADSEVQGGHAFRVMGAYERWFAGEGESGERVLAVLRLLGLFDRPASAELLGVLRRAPAIPGLTEPLVNVSEEDWNLAVSRLEECGLVARNGDEGGGGLDAHPLVREHFGRRIREECEEGFKAAHGRLFDYLKDTTEHWPDSLEDLQPLYQAVFHGCLAGRHEEARTSIYLKRILRLKEAYSTSILGAFGADLAALSCFFDSPWGVVSPMIPENALTWLQHETAFCLRALGRLQEARVLMKALQPDILRSSNTDGASRSAANLSELELTLGSIEESLDLGSQSVRIADQSRNLFNRLYCRTTLATALFQAGVTDKACVYFREAEELQAEWQPDFPLLYSLQGFRYCDLLLETVEKAAWRGDAAGLDELLIGVELRTARTLKWAERSHGLLNIALDHLTLGRIQLYRSLLAGTVSEAAKDSVERALASLRGAGTVDHIPTALLTRSWLRSALGDEAGARADLAEAQEIAERGPMPLFLADIALYRARLFRDRAALAEARRLVEKHGYGRRREEVADLEAVAGGW